MRIVFQIIDGPLTGQALTLESGQSIQIGRTTRAQFVIPNDLFLSGLHLEINCDNHGARVRDLGSSNGTFLNGVRIIDEIVRDGDQIQAGETHLQALVDAPIAAPVPMTTALFALHEFPPAVSRPPAPELSAVGAILRVLQGQPGKLYALLDAAVRDSVPELLKTYGEPFQSLYEGKRAEELAMTAPYLVELPYESPLLSRLIADGRGGNWVTWVVSAQSLAGVRKHFRRFLTVETEDSKKFFFRFYDPRILQLFLPASTPEEIREFFGPVEVFLMEALEEPDALIQFTAGLKGVQRKVISFVVTA